MSGFYIKNLTVKSSVRPDAELTFDKGANLITGASDTGKTYVFSAINYVLGSSEAPKEIIESVDYTDFFLEINTYDDIKYTLFRKLGQNHIEVKPVAMDKFAISATGKKYKAKGNAEDSISAFLLSLSGLFGKKLLYNKTNGETRNTSFSYLRKLTFVSEESIIKTASPFYFSSQYFDQNLSQSLLNVLLSGEDHSDVIQKESKATKEMRINGKLEFLSYQVSQLAAEKDSTVNFIANSNNDYDAKRLALDTELRQNIFEAKVIADKKNELTRSRQIWIEELRYKGELSSRFSILETQYKADSDRLEFILEAEMLSSQLGDTVCPICSSPLTSDHLQHFSQQEKFREAALEELEKNKSKLAGLKETIINNTEEIKQLQGKIDEIEKELLQLEYSLTNNFTPKIKQLKADLQDFLDYESQFNKLTFIDDQIQKLYEEKSRLEVLLNTSEKSEEINIVPYHILSKLAKNIEQRLKNWSYEPFVTVDFDSNYQVFDIVISGKNRKSYGKGKRAISYAACLFGMLDQCCNDQFDFSKLLMLDSPLTTFEEKKKSAGSEIQSEVLRSFFIDLIKLPEASQVIIFDNKEPDPDTFKLISDKLKLHVFTGTSHGRYGFFPVSTK